MFQLLSNSGLWHEIFNPWVVRCNSDRTDCHTFWRKSRTAYASEHETLVSFMERIGVYTPKPAADAVDATPVVTAVPVTSASAA
mmetsp:Transcript_21306/g.53478  ORF Transcript_21306/g.53478 Transcript_21306/m.53478 type:complete len:84 (+) Transcript_21306:60-311(+)